MCGDYHSVIGMEKTEPLRRFITGMAKERFTPANEEATLSGVFVETDAKGVATTVVPVRQGGRLAPSGASVTHRWFPLAALLGLGCVWGLTMPLTKIAVSTGNGHFGIIFWQLLIVMATLLVLGVLRGQQVYPRLYHVPLFCVVACFGTLIPNSLSYIAAAELPSGVLSIIMSLVPMSALPIALIMGVERFEAIRLTGLVFGAAAMVLLIGPEASLPDPTKAIFVVIAALATICYGFESNYVGRFGLNGLSPQQVMFYASGVGLVAVTPLAVGSGQFYVPTADWGTDDWALLVSSVSHALAYTGFLWLIGRAGAVFAAQISYIVTGFGVLASMILLGERYSGYIWLALGLVMIGLLLVQPRGQGDNQG